MVVSFISILLYFTGITHPHPLHIDNITDEGINKEIMLLLINAARQKGCRCNGRYYPPVPPLKWNDKLEKAAKEHSEDMLAKHYFSHTDPHGTDAGSRIEATGYVWTSYAENIGMGYHSEEDVVNGWLHSEGHCSNIMDRSYKEMGVGRAGTYWTQDFGSRK